MPGLTRFGLTGSLLYVTLLLLHTKEQLRLLNLCVPGAKTIYQFYKSLPNILFLVRPSL